MAEMQELEALKRRVDDLRVKHQVGQQQLQQAAQAMQTQGLEVPPEVTKASLSRVLAAALQSAQDDEAKALQDFQRAYSALEAEVQKAGAAG